MKSKVVLRWASGAALALLTGCFTVSESDYPATVMTGAGEGADISVKVDGFEAELVEYVTSYGYETLYTGGWYGRHGRYHPGYLTVVPTSYTVPEAFATDMFKVRATDRLEAAGFITKAPTPDYLVEVRFDGPAGGSFGMRMLWLLGTIFTCDDATVAWSAKLKVYDNRTGKVVLAQDYVQDYHVRGFSPIPIFGPAAYDGTSSNNMEVWCLSALTDRVTADVSAFLAARRQGR